MKTLILLRHGKAHHSAIHDMDRALSDRGKSDLAMAGERLRQLLPPDAAGAVSAARRTMETSSAISNLTGWTPPAGSAGGYLAPALFWIKEITSWADTQHVGIAIGHNPGLSDLASELTSEDIWLPTSGFARIQFDVEHWMEVSRGTGELMEIWTPNATFGA